MTTSPRARCGLCNPASTLSSPVGAGPAGTEPAAHVQEGSRSGSPPCCPQPYSTRGHSTVHYRECKLCPQTGPNSRRESPCFRFVSSTNAFSASPSSAEWLFQHGGSCLKQLHLSLKGLPSLRP